MRIFYFALILNVVSMYELHEQTEESTECKWPTVPVGCATMCPPTCQLPEPEACTRACDPNVRCVCPEGMVQRSKQNRTCIEKWQCHKRCKKPKVYAKCASYCPPTCDDPDPRCKRGCDDRVECVCPSNMVQISEEDTTCVKFYDCPAKCDKPKVYVKCATLCPPTCDSPTPKLCPPTCDPAVECVCPEHLLQRNRTDTTCIYPSECPKPAKEVKCKKPKIYTECATMCPPTCDYLKPKVCTRACDPAVQCICPRHLVQRSKGDTECIKPSQCPKKEPINCELTEWTYAGPCKVHWSGSVKLQKLIRYIIADEKNGGRKCSDYLLVRYVSCKEEEKEH